MQPRKAKDIIAEYAQQKGINPQHLEKVYNAAFQTMKDMMTGYEFNMLNMPYLGTFFFRVWKIEEEVQKCNNILRAAKLPVSVLDAIQDKRRKLIDMDAMILAEMVRRQEKRELKNSWDINHGQRSYKRGLCNCAICKGDHSLKTRTTRANRKAEKKREEYRQSLIKRYNESQGQTPEGMGEQS